MLAGKVGAFEFPDCHVFISACYDLLFVIGTEFDSEDRLVACVPVGQCPALLPLKHLERKGLIHANGSNKRAIVREGNVKDAALMRSFQDDQSLHGGSIPDMNSWAQMGRLPCCDY